VNDEHVFAFIEAINRAYLDAVCVFAVDAVLIDDVGHLKILRRMRSVYEAWPEPFRFVAQITVPNKAPQTCRHGQISRYI
jgi:hypothetical protein